MLFNNTLTLYFISWTLCTIILKLLILLMNRRTDSLLFNDAFKHARELFLLHLHEKLIVNCLLGVALHWFREKMGHHLPLSCYTHTPECISIQQFVGNGNSPTIISFFPTRPSWTSAIDLFYSKQHSCIRSRTSILPQRRNTWPMKYSQRSSIYDEAIKKKNRMHSSSFMYLSTNTRVET